LVTFAPVESGDYVPVLLVQPGGNPRTGIRGVRGRILVVDHAVLGLVHRAADPEAGLSGLRPPAVSPRAGCGGRPERVLIPRNLVDPGADGLLVEHGLVLG
jgi:hypothetical protein